MQVFLYRDRDFTQELVRRAEVADYDAIVLTIDNQVLGKRERDLANGFTIPPKFSPSQYAAMLGKHKWFCIRNSGGAGSMIGFPYTAGDEKSQKKADLCSSSALSSSYNSKHV